MSSQIKAIVGAAAAGVSALALAAIDGVTLAEGLSALGVALATYAGVYLAPRNQYKDEKQDAL